MTSGTPQVYREAVRHAPMGLYGQITCRCGRPPRISDYGERSGPRGGRNDRLALPAIGSQTARNTRFAAGDGASDPSRRFRPMIALDTIVVRYLAGTVQFGSVEKPDPLSSRSSAVTSRSP